jgi:hypothetical protein
LLKKKYIVLRKISFKAKLLRVGRPSLLIRWKKGIGGFLERIIRFTFEEEKHPILSENG